mmetsp:Transcript_8898/g.7886  ORF Transcript_8898/g.7886 Transcript_8898/m.7886 type:complete len:86 (+) Transcript_8898:184-441(+)
MDVIKQKYRELVLVHHPDRNKGIQSAFFTKLQEAYVILSHPKTRLRYDMFININNPDFNPIEAQSKLRDKYMTKEEKRVHTMKKK